MLVRDDDFKKQTPKSQGLLLVRKICIEIYNAVFRHMVSVCCSVLQTSEVDLTELGLLKANCTAAEEITTCMMSQLPPLQTCNPGDS